MIEIFKNSYIRTGPKNGAHVNKKYASRKKVHYEAIWLTDEVRINGDEHLLRRLFRNALDNAFSFAKESVSVKLEVRINEIIITITDDGNGMSLETLKSFGQRKATRVQEQSVDGRVSIGLGSVIMKTVAEIHGGKLQVKNKLNSSGVLLGAQVDIFLPSK